jgi:L-rhamnose isomerase/sugar isomerase
LRRNLSAGSINPINSSRLQRTRDAACDPSVKKSRPRFEPAYLIDQSHNLKDPIEDLMLSAIEIHRALTKVLLVDREALASYQESNDVVMAERTLKAAYETDVSAILAEVRRRRGAAIDPLNVYRRCGYRESTVRSRRSFSK